MEEKQVKGQPQRWEKVWQSRNFDLDEECHRKVELAVKRIMEKEGVTEQLKRKI